MPYQHIAVEPLTPTIGAVVSEATIADANDATLAEIHDAWMEHCVLFFRDQRSPRNSISRSGAALAPCTYTPRHPTPTATRRSW